MWNLLLFRLLVVLVAAAAASGVCDTNMFEYLKVLNGLTIRVFYFFFALLSGCSVALHAKNRVCVHTTIELDFGLFAVVVMGCYTHAGNSFSFVLCLVCCFATQFETHTQTIRYCFTGEAEDERNRRKDVEKLQ